MGPKPCASIMHLGALALAILLLATPLAIDAQLTAKVPLVGVLLPGSPVSEAPHVEAFRRGLRELGWVEGVNYVSEYRYANYAPEKLAELVTELASLQVDVVTGWTPTPPTFKPHGKIPIVVAAVGPLPEVGAKSVELLRELLPTAARVAVLSNPTDPETEATLKEMERTARTVSIRLEAVDVRDARGLERAFSRLREQADAIVVLNDPVVFRLRTQIVDLAAKSQLPAVYGQRDYADAGGLIAYGPNPLGRLVPYVDRIFKVLKGGRRGPFTEPALRYELVINIKTAKDLSLTIPPVLLLRADQVIE